MAGGFSGPQGQETKLGCLGVKEGMRWKCGQREQV